MEEIIIRAIKSGDLDAIVGIDARVLGKARPEYWETKMDLSQTRSPMASLVAEVGGKVVGFILGDASGWEYGIPETIGYIDTIGVDPEYQRHGVARLLVREMITHLRKVGVRTIYTYVNWRDGDLLRFFDQTGFVRGDMVNLELKV
ncbi:MAG: GNAT family N-acetyltransferase [Proteobacteria bacterium]|nr:GNAT family N-acetyltransferase [Pseudomonadota bacterium]MBU1740648.1 GNAT family N-acetyltransferase [Pseudomonadota bacterium]